jgi:hypothetical protein
MYLCKHSSGQRGRPYRPSGHALYSAELPWHVPYISQSRHALHSTRHVPAGAAGTCPQAHAKRHAASGTSPEVSQERAAPEVWQVHVYGQRPRRQRPRGTCPEVWQAQPRRCGRHSLPPAWRYGGRVLTSTAAPREASRVRRRLATAWLLPGYCRRPLVRVSEPWCRLLTWRWRAGAVHARLGQLPARPCNALSARPCDALPARPCNALPARPCNALSARPPFSWVRSLAAEGKPNAPCPGPRRLE